MKRPPGRPRKSETAELTRALIAKQRALARRTAARINRLLDTHVMRGPLTRVYVRMVDATAARLRRLPRDARTAGLVDETGETAIRELIDQAVAELPITPEDRALAAGPQPPDEPPAVVHHVGTLAAARAQVARLQARRLDLEDRIGPFEDHAHPQRRAARARRT